MYFYSYSTCFHSHESLSADLNDTLDDEVNDPEYNFLADEEEMDVEEFRNDRAVSITSQSHSH